MSFEAGPKRVVTPLLTTPLVNSGGGKIVSEKKGEPFSGLLSLNFPFFTSGGTSGAYRGMGDRRGRQVRGGGGVQVQAWTGRPVGQETPHSDVIGDGG